MSGELLRASDDDRDRAIASLRDHLAAGRLTLEELTERMSAALAAMTTADLDAQLRELRRVYAFGVFAGMDVWRVPLAWAKRTFGEAIEGIERGEHRELEP